VENLVEAKMKKGTSN